MSWARYDDELPMNRKVVALRAHGLHGTAALGLHLLANTWCRHNGTGGRVPAHVPEVLVGKDGAKLAGILCAVGMFDADSDDGWTIHDYAEFHDPKDPNPDRSAADRKKDLSVKRAEAGRRGGLVKAGKLPSKVASKSVANGWQTPSPVPVPDPVSVTEKSSSSSAQTDDDDVLRCAQIMVDAKTAGRKIDNLASYRLVALRNTLAEQGDAIRARLDEGSTPEQVAQALTAGQEAAPRRDAWYADPRCETCGGDGWASTEQDERSYVAPCACRRPDPYPLAEVVSIDTRRAS